MTSTPMGEPSTSDNHRERMRALQHDFLECVASGYTAGIVRFSGDDFCVSVSIPVARLATMIPPRALVAWDPVKNNQKETGRFE